MKTFLPIEGEKRPIPANPGSRCIIVRIYIPKSSTECVKGVILQATRKVKILGAFSRPTGARCTVFLAVTTILPEEQSRTKQ